MKLSSRRFKFLGIAVLASLIFIPLLVFGYNYNTLLGLPAIKHQTTSPVFHYQDDSQSSIYWLGTCIQNTSDNDYFIPTRTLTEWNAFFNHQPPGVTLFACCGDGACNGAETCGSCPTDCYSCLTCETFTYSAWSGCVGGTQTRSILSQGPVSCTGGNPIVSQSCSCTVQGCISGTCRNGYVYLSSNACYGSPIIQTNICINSSVPNSSCIAGGPNNSNYYVPSLGCSYSAACSTSGCPSGYSCRTGSPYLGSTNCTGNNSGPLYSICIADSNPNYSCISLNAITSISYVPGSGCSY